MRIFFIIILLLSFSCKDGDTPGSGDSESTASTEADQTIYSVSGKIHKGKCLKDGEVSVQPLINGSFDQVGNHFTGYTSEFGYNIPVEIDQEYSEIFANVDCDDEVNSGQENYRLSGIVKNSDPAKNLNPLTKIRSIVARHLFYNYFGKVEDCLIEAESMILNYFSMPTTGRFTAMSLESNNIQDSVLLSVNSAILYDRNGPQQGDYIVTLAEGIISNDLDLRAEFLAIYDHLPIITIKENLENSFGSSPPFWQLIAPDLNDLLGNDHGIIGSFNIDDSMGCSFDTNGYNTFAIPHIFKSWIETSKYLPSNLNGDLSIWSHVFQGYDRPGTKVLDIERLSRNIFNLQHPGKLGDHNLIAGEWYYFVIRRDSGFRLSTGCNGGLLPFGRKLASKDNGQNWIGHNINTSWFRKSGIMMYGLN